MKDLTVTGWRLLDEALEKAGPRLPELTFEIERLAKERWGYNWNSRLWKVGLGKVKQIMNEIEAVRSGYYKKCN